jgi:predicted translin family RNA/ssDNA-binding protein
MYGESYTGMSKAQISPTRCSCELRIDAQQFQDCVCDVIGEMQKERIDKCQITGVTMFRAWYCDQEELFLGCLMF